MIRSMALLVFLVLMGTAVPGWTAPDEVQRQILQHFIESEKKLAQAGKAEGEERQRLIGEHMQAMRRAIEQIRAAKPRSGMSPVEQSEWIAEHQRLMDLLLDQLMVQYGLLMQEIRHSVHALNVVEPAAWPTRLPPRSALPTSAWR